jgi:hypothetical protein
MVLAEFLPTAAMTAGQGTAQCLVFARLGQGDRAQQSKLRPRGGRGEKKEPLHPPMDPTSWLRAPVIFAHSCGDVCWGAASNVSTGRILEIPSCPGAWGECKEDGGRCSVPSHCFEGKYPALAWLYSVSMISIHTARFMVPSRLDFPLLHTAAVLLSRAGRPRSFCPLQ